jgi:hypothetical protein
MHLLRESERPVISLKRKELSIGSFDLQIGGMVLPLNQQLQEARSRSYLALRHAEGLACSAIQNSQESTQRQQLSAVLARFT